MLSGLRGHLTGVVGFVQFDPAEGLELIGADDADRVPGPIMPSYEHVKRLARELVLPDDADLVIQRSKYWIPAFCWLYFRRCDELILEVPEDGLAAAEVCPELVHLTQRHTRQPQDRLRLRALAVLGTGYRATDDLDQAEVIYKAAFKLLRSSAAIPRSDAANLFSRFAYVLCFRNRYEPAAEIAGQSIGIYREAPDDVRRRHLGEALTARGYIHHMNGQPAPAMKDWGEAVSCTDVKLTPRIFYVVVHNLALGMTQRVVPSRDLSTIEKYVTQAGRCFSGKHLSVPKLKVLWIRGMIMVRFGSTRRGEGAYRKVIGGFLKLGKIVDMALVSVTLGEHLHREHRFEELQALAIETSDLCERLCKHEPVKRAVFIWKETVVARTVTAEVFTTTWNVLETSSFADASGLTVDVIASPPRIGVED